MPSTGLASAPARVIIHFDLDAFYAQVEHERLGIPRDVPLGVQQWASLIANNYPSRKYGIKRGMTVEEAKKRCPDFVAVHVELIGESGPFDLAPNGKLSSSTWGSYKASLSRYRSASMKVMSNAKQACAGLDCIFERASIDEFYVDVSAAVDAIIASSSELDVLKTEFRGREIKESLSHSQIAGTPPDSFPAEEADYRLIVGAAIAKSIRASILGALNFTVSAGIAHSRLTAKVASAQNKPDKQTIVPRRGAANAFAPVSLKKLPQLGGKAGTAVIDFLASREKKETFCAGDLQGIPLSELAARFGRSKAQYLYNRCRGLDGDEVKPRPAVKSIQAFKSGEDALKTAQGIAKWLNILSLEVAIRILEDTTENKRIPGTMKIYYSPARLGARHDAAKTFCCSLPASINSSRAREDVYLMRDLICKAANDLLIRGTSEHHAMKLSKDDLRAAAPCYRIGLEVCAFTPFTVGRGAIDSMFAKAAAESPVPFHVPLQREPTCQKSPSRGAWTCSRCTFRNTSSKNLCEMCGSLSKRKGHSSSSSNKRKRKKPTRTIVSMFKN